jgi:hypothetical protein
MDVCKQGRWPVLATKRLVLVVALCVAAAGTLFTRVTEEADASSAPLSPADSVGPLLEAPFVVSPQGNQADPFYYQFGPYVFPPVLRVHEPPAVDTDPPASATPVEQQHYRYYCEDSNAYFPDVGTCARGWQRVLPHPNP